MSDKSYKYPYGLSFFEITVIRLLIILCLKNKSYGFSEETNHYLRKLKKEVKL